MPYPNLICEPVSLPVPPEQLVAELLDSLANGSLPRIERQAKVLEHTGTMMQRLVNFQGHEAPSRSALKYHLTQDLAHWMQQHAPKGHHEMCVAYSDGSDIHAPHVDANRNYVLIMPLVANDAAVNSWWHKKGHDVEFAKDTWPSVIADYREVDLINRARLKVNRWYVFNTYIYHSVEHCDGPRVSLQVDYHTWGSAQRKKATNYADL
jgi:hypothetical protein